jgi:hypothetical protein
VSNVRNGKALVRALLVGSENEIANFSLKTRDTDCLLKARKEVGTAQACKDACEMKSRRLAGQEYR